MASIRAAIVFATCWGAAWPHSAPAALDYSSIGSTYTQNFDTLAATGTDLAWTNDSTLAGWSLFRVPSNSSLTPPVAIDAYDAGDGSVDTPRFYSFGPASGPQTSDRALGAIGHANLANFGGSGLLGNGAVVGWITAGLMNNTGSELTEFTAGFAGEQWRDGGDTPDAPNTMTFEYGFGTSFDAVSTWAVPAQSNFTRDSPQSTSTAGPVDGNTTGRAAGRGGTISGLSWAAGVTLWLRWVERNEIGLDDGLAIDDFTFSATTSPVPEPGAFLLGALFCGLFGLALHVIRTAAHSKQERAALHTCQNSVAE